jgi:hypothetical protein
MFLENDICDIYIEMDLNSTINKIIIIYFGNRQKKKLTKSWINGTVYNQNQTHHLFIIF